MDTFKSLEGRRALITGGGTGLGAALARGFAAHGAEVVVAGRRPEPVEAVAAANDGVSAATVDVTDEASVDQLFESVGPVDIVIANAGSSTSAPFHRTTTDMWNDMIGANLTGVFLTLRGGWSQMRGRGWGRLLAVSSTAGVRGYGYVAAYAAAKHGAVGLVKSLAIEVAGSGVTANALCPGFLATEMTDRTIDNIVATTGRSREDALAALTSDSAMGRLVEPDEVVAAALWLCGPSSEAANGQAVVLDGGAS